MAISINVVVLVSGSGTNLQAVIDATKTAIPSIPNARITHVISNRKNAYGLTRARHAGIPTTIHNLITGGYTTRFPNRPDQVNEGVVERNDQFMSTAPTSASPTETNAASEGDRSSRDCTHHDSTSTSSGNKISKASPSRPPAHGTGTTDSSPSRHSQTFTPDPISTESTDSALPSKSYPPEAKVHETILPSDQKQPKYSQPPSPKPASRKAREVYDADLASTLLSLEPPAHLVLLAGFMHILTPCFLNPLSQQNIPVINLHPALPGTYIGSNAIDRAWADWASMQPRNDSQITLEARGAGESVRTGQSLHGEGGVGRQGKTGCMIHHVIAEVDLGAPICVREVDFRQGESREDWENRFHSVERVCTVDGTRTIVEELVRKMKPDAG